MGRSRGGFSSKIHAVVDTLGNPVDFILTGGEVADVTQAGLLLKNKQANYVLGDKGYDSQALIDGLKARKIEGVIPPRLNRKEQREYDKHWYKDRNLVERFFDKIKHYRRVATRYDKTAVSFLAMIHLASSLILLK